jgi:tyrosine-protein phosphatase SIW14
VAAAIVVVAAQEAYRAISYGDEKLSIDGVSNFGRVRPRLYRGAQPSSLGFAALKKLGIDIDVRLSLGEEGGAAEAREVEALGMQFVSLPWSSEHLPTRAQVVTFFRLLHDHPKQTIFLHCKWGADRTGVMVALSRMAFDHWTPARALDEMKAFHYHYIFLPHLQRYVEGFPADLASDPGLLDFAEASGF